MTAVARLLKVRPTANGKPYQNLVPSSQVVLFPSLPSVICKGDEQPSSYSIPPYPAQPAASYPLSPSESSVSLVISNHPRSHARAGAHSHSYNIHTHTHTRNHVSYPKPQLDYTTRKETQRELLHNVAPDRPLNPSPSHPPTIGTSPLAVAPTPTLILVLAFLLHHSSSVPIPTY